MPPRQGDAEKSAASPCDIAYKEVEFMNKEQFKGSWRQFTRTLKKRWGLLADNDLLGVAGDDDRFKGAVQKRYGDQKEEAARWAEDWCERGGWRNHPPTHRE